MADYQPVAELLAQLRAADIHADVKLEDVRLPGVWVRLVTVEPYALDGTDVITAEMVCVVGETSSDRAYKKLLALHQAVKVALDGHEDTARFVTVNIPEGAAVPGLAIPVQLIP